MNDAQALTRKLQLKAGSRLWVWPDSAPEAAILTEVANFERSDASDVDVAVIFAADREAVDTVFTQHADALASGRAVWIVYAKGNKTDMNRDTLWIQLAGYGWKAVSQVAYGKDLSALRVRPLKPGEAPSA